jgi:hypothetical protein
MTVTSELQMENARRSFFSQRQSQDSKVSVADVFRLKEVGLWLNKSFEVL